MMQRRVISWPLSRSTAIVYNSSTMSGYLPPLIPNVDAILVLDGDGNRLAGKYYGKFLKTGTGDKSAEDLRTHFEKTLRNKIIHIPARSDAAEVVTCQGKTAVFCGGGVGGPSDVKIVHIGSTLESEIVLAHLCEGMYEALSHLMGGSTDRAMVLDNLELVFLLIDEHCDGGIILEVDGHKLASAVLLRDEEMDGDSERAMQQQQPMQQQGMPAGVGAADMTIGQALRQAREQFMAGMAGRDGM